MSASYKSPKNPNYKQQHETSSHRQPMQGLHCSSNRQHILVCQSTQVAIQMEQGGNTGGANPARKEFCIPANGRAMQKALSRASSILTSYRCLDQHGTAPVPTATQSTAYTYKCCTCTCSTGLFRRLVQKEPAVLIPSKAGHRQWCRGIQQEHSVSAANRPASTIECSTCKPPPKRLTSLSISPKRGHSAGSLLYMPVSLSPT